MIIHTILINEDHGSGKAHSLFNLISQQSYIDKIYLYIKDPHEAKDFILKLILKTQMKWLIFMKTLKNAIQKKTHKIICFL